jgi:hypothetical protein
MASSAGEATVRWSHRAQGLRVATFVDAGFLLGAAATEVLGKPRREALRCDYGAFLAAVHEHVARHSGEAPSLRTYWYDAAPRGQALPEHKRIALLPYVKLRLGHLGPSGQKGVGVLMHSDLLTLAHERAIGRAYLVAGDEDLREAVAEAQRLGLQVVIVGLPSTLGHSQSPELVRECDDDLVLPREAWAPHFSERDIADDEAGSDDVVLARRIAREYAEAWSARTDAQERKAVLAALPKLPRQLDVDLLHAGEEQLGSLRRRPDLKQEMRFVFAHAVRGAGGAGGGSAGGRNGDGEDGDRA